MKDLFGNPICNPTNPKTSKACLRLPAPSKARQAGQAKRGRQATRFTQWRETNNYPLTLHENDIRYLSNTDILTYLLRDPDKAQKLSTNYDDFTEIAMSDLKELQKAADLTEREAQIINVAFELGRRLLSCQKKEKDKIGGDKDAYNAVAGELRGLDHEELLLVTLNTKNQIIRKHRVFRGGLNNSVCSRHTILRTALLDNAASIIIAHNHPSGSSNPSTEDITITKALAIACKSVEIRLLDHIVVGDNDDFTSMHEQQII